MEDRSTSSDYDIPLRVGVDYSIEDICWKIRCIWNGRAIVLRSEDEPTTEELQVLNKFLSDELRIGQQVRVRTLKRHLEEYGQEDWS